MTSRTTDSRHTPGPWTVSVNNDSDIHQINAATDAVATSLFCYADEREANFNLMAAAPELFEALRTIANDPIDEPATWGGAAEWMRRIARQAISKATGAA